MSRHSRILREGCGVVGKDFLISSSQNRKTICVNRCSLPHGPCERLQHSLFSASKQI